MPRLKSVGPRLGTLPARLGGSQRNEKQRTRFRDQTQPWRKWYKTARWQRLRLIVLQRDGYTCQATGVALIGAYPAPNSPVVDHKTPHRGNPDLFWDLDNLHAVSMEWHSGPKQSQERQGWI